MVRLIVLLVLMGLSYFFIPSKKIPLRALGSEIMNDQDVNSDQVSRSCNAQKCVMVYLAPWCPACLASTDAIISLANDLYEEDIDVSIVIGSDRFDKIEAYSKKFSFPIITDADGLYYRELGINSVPTFFVTDEDGKLLKSVSGGSDNVWVLRDQLEL